MGRVEGAPLPRGGSEARHVRHVKFDQATSLSEGFVSRVPVTPIERPAERSRDNIGMKV